MKQNKQQCVQSMVNLHGHFSLESIHTNKEVYQHEMVDASSDQWYQTVTARHIQQAHVYLNRLGKNLNRIIQDN